MGLCFKMVYSFNDQKSIQAGEKWFGYFVSTLRKGRLNYCVCVFFYVSFHDVQNFKHFVWCNPFSGYVFLAKLNLSRDSYSGKSRSVTPR